MKKLKFVLGGIVVAAMALMVGVPVMATTSMSLSPMNQYLILVPGESSSGSITVTNPASSDVTLDFEASIVPFYVNDEYSADFESEGEYNQLVDWITLDVSKGRLEPNSSFDIRYEINVPKDAPKGGQYAAIQVVSGGSNTSGEEDEGIGIGITNRIAISHILYTEIAGTTVYDGEISGVKVPSFMFSGKIRGESAIKNTGNVHGEAKYTLRVFPLFSNEEVYTNEENPDVKTILPDRTRYNETAWEETPGFGVFNVEYAVEFNGITKTVKKMVVICPVWLLFVLVFVVILLIFGGVARRRRK